MHPDERWYSYSLSQHPDITIDIVRSICSRDGERDSCITYGSWIWYYLSRNVPIADVLKNPYLPWDLEGLSLNKDISIEIIDADLPNVRGEWNWYYISMNIDPYDFLQHRDRPWDPKGLSYNRKIPMSMLMDKEEELPPSIPRRIYDTEFIFGS
jgi:hypothetical protein